MRPVHDPAGTPPGAEGTTSGTRAEALHRLLLLLAQGPGPSDFLAVLVHGILREDLARTAALAAIGRSGHLIVTAA